MRLTSIRFRLLLWNMGVLIVVLGGVLLVMHIAIRSYLISGIDRRLTGMAERQVEFFLNPPRNESRPAPPPPLNDERSRAAVVRMQRMFRIFDVEGHSLTPMGTRTETSILPYDTAAFTSACAGETVFSTVKIEQTTNRVLSQPILRNAKPVAVIQVALSYTEAEVLLESVTKTLLIIAPCALLLAAFGGLFLTQRALLPVRQIIGAAEAMDHQDLSQRLPVTGADEFAHLATNINGMLDRLQVAFTQLQESIIRERRFTADASHELRTPLTAMKANTSLALRGERTPAEYREAIVAVDQAADQMTRLVQDLLLLARSDSGQLAVDLQEIDAQVLLQDTLPLVAHGPQHALINSEIAEDAQVFHGDPYHLQRVLINLLENAVRYTPVDGQVTVAITRAGMQTIIAIRDSGEGIAPEHLPHLGERFYRVDTARARRHGGAGLGLAICRSIVEAHQGTMEIASTPGEGSCVIITLPNAGDPA